MLKFSLDENPKPVKKSPKKPAFKAKTPNKNNSNKNRIKVLGEKLRKIGRKLDELQSYKRLVAEDGIRPDEHDKERETQLIRLKIRHERELAELEGRPIVKGRKKVKFSPKPKPKKRFN